MMCPSTEIYRTGYSLKKQKMVTQLHHFKNINRKNNPKKSPNTWLSFLLYVSILEKEGTVSEVLWLVCMLLSHKLSELR